MLYEVRMDPREFLWKFMEGKAKRLPAKLRELYLRPEDRESLLALPYEKAVPVASELLFKALAGDLESLQTTNCPYCLIWEFSCKACPYSAFHKECTKEGSDFRTLIQRLGDLGLSASYLLPPSFYRSLAKELVQLPSPPKGKYWRTHLFYWEPRGRAFLCFGRNLTPFLAFKTKSFFPTHLGRGQHRAIRLKSKSSSYSRTICEDCNLEELELLWIGEHSSPKEEQR